MSADLIPSPAPSPAPITHKSAPDLDGQVTQLWLHGRSPHTQDAYRRDIARFVAFVDRPLRAVTLSDLQAFADSLGELAPSSRKRTLSAVKSLLSFAHRTGHLEYNVGAALLLPKSKNTIGERILSEEQVAALIDGEPHARNHLLLRLLYATGARVSEIARLCWRDVQRQKSGWQLTLYGKGQKTRHVLLGTDTALELLEHKAAPDQPVFASARGGALGRQQIYRIVAEAARRAGIAGDVSPHWLRHAHASHALDRGAPAHLVQATLGHASLDTTTRYAHARPTDSSARYLTI